MHKRSDSGKLALSSHLFLVNTSKTQYDAIQAQHKKMVRRVKALNVLETQTPSLEPRLKLAKTTSTLVFNTCI